MGRVCACSLRSRLVSRQPLRTFHCLYHSWTQSHTRGSPLVPWQEPTCPVWSPAVAHSLSSLGYQDIRMLGYRDIRIGGYHPGISVYQDIRISHCTGLSVYQIGASMPTTGQATTAVSSLSPVSMSSVSCSHISGWQEAPKGALHPATWWLCSLCSFPCTCSCPCCSSQQQQTCCKQVRRFPVQPLL